MLIPKFGSNVDTVKVLAMLIAFIPKMMTK